METELEYLQNNARVLEPDQGSRSLLRDEVEQYTDLFLGQLDTMPGYVTGEFKELSALKIDENGKPLQKLLGILKNEVDHIGINTASGRHLGFIPGGGLWSSSMADLLAATTNRYAGIAFSNPGSVQIEDQLIEWLKSIVCYPEEAYGNLTSGGSVANLIAIKAARDHQNINASNVKKTVVYLTAYSHHCIHKALHITGLYEGVLRIVPVSASFKMDTQALEKIVTEDKSNGLQPALVVASAGTTDTGAVDDLQAIAAICKENNIWMHVDAAYGGFFMMVEEIKQKFQGIEQSDSLVLDPHKTLFMPYGSGAVLIRDKHILLRSNAYKASYLKDSFDTADINPADTGIELSRHNRALRMWLPLHLHGVKPFREALKEKIVLTKLFLERIQHLGFETGPTPDLTIVIFRLPDDDTNFINQLLLDEIHLDGTVFLSSTTINGRLWIRCAIVSHRTHLKEIELALDMIKRCKNKVFHKGINSIF